MAEDFDDDLDLNTLNDEDLTEQVHDDLYNGLRDEVVEATNILLGRGWSADRVLNDALVEGMRIVGVDFRDGILGGEVPVENDEVAVFFDRVAQRADDRLPS